MQLSDLETKYNQLVKLTSASDVFNEMQDVKDAAKEIFVVFNLDIAGKVISREIVSIGILNACVIHAREIYKNAIILVANSIVIGHNHPSGEVEPSEEDIRVTGQIKKAGDIIGIKLLDHVIVGKDGYYSFQENNEL